MSAKSVATSSNYVEVLLTGIGHTMRRYASRHRRRCGGLRILDIATECDVVIEAWPIEVLARRAVCMTWQI